MAAGAGRVSIQCVQFRDARSVTVETRGCGVVSPPHSTVPSQIEPAHFEIFSLRGEVHWRLLSRNNRNGGQSSSGFADVAACQSGIARLIDVLAELRPQYVLTDGKRWEWALALGEEVLARSSHSFDRRIRCVSACEWFYRTAPLATVHDRLRIVRGPTADPPRIPKPGRHPDDRRPG
jgi:hypothetical protein